MKPLQLHEIADLRDRHLQKIMAWAKKKSAEAHPETGGRDIPVRNWGNGQAKNIWRKAWKMAQKSTDTFDRLIPMGWHLLHQNWPETETQPLWCPICQAEAQKRREAA